MAGVLTEDYGTSGDRSATLDGMSSEQRCQSGDSIAEWRSCEQVENGTPSTSPLYWDTDDDDDDCGPKPAELFGRFTWKIENFSTINKRELRSNAFEVGGYKWYILIYPQGCDVCNHLSLFLCVANHDKLLPGWSHFAQFTIAVVNKDPKKSKYSDTLHRFWKKEHDWGWKKFMELSKVYDGFVVADTLVIKSQVQVIREKAHRPFRCLDCQYRRELVRVYLSNVEQICRRFIEERIGKLSKLIEDKIRWPSFCTFWLGTDPNARRRMSRDKTDAILKVVVKHFFIEKEVTSTLVMDSLYSGLKALEYQSKSKNVGAKFLDLEKLPSPMVRIDKDMFVLADDVLLLLERAVKEPLTHQPLPPKDDKCSQNRTKEGSSGEEFCKDSIERDERRLMELGRRTVEIFVLVHIFSRIEVSYQEAVALMRQEELIREEEAAVHAKNELRAKRGGSEKEKRSKKKQAKQKRNGHKGKDKGRNGISDVVQEKLPQECPSDDSVQDDYTSKKEESIDKKIDVPEDSSDVSDNGNVGEVHQPDLDDRDASPVNWDTDTSELPVTEEASGSNITHIQLEKRIQSALDDSSSTCSTDSLPSVVMNGSYKGNSWPINKSQSTPSRGKNNRNREANIRIASPQKVITARPDAAPDCGSSFDIAASKVSQSEPDAVELPLKNEIARIHKRSVEKDLEVAGGRKETIANDLVDVDKLGKAKIRESPSSSSVEKPSIVVRQASTAPETPNSTTFSTAAGSTKLLSTKDSPSSILPLQVAKLPPLDLKLPPVPTETLGHNHPAKSSGAHQASIVSRPSSAPLAPAPTPRPVAPVASTAQSAPVLSRSVSAAGRLGTDPSPSAPSYVPQSYRNAIIGKSATTNTSNATSLTHQTTSSGQSISYPHPPSTFVVSPPVLPPHISGRTDQMSIRPGFTFGSVKPDALNSWQLSRDDAHPEAASSSGRYSLDLEAGIERLELHERRKHISSEMALRSVPYQAQGVVVADEFPHLDIINDLLDEENNGRSSRAHHNFSRQYSFPLDNSVMDISSFSGSGRFDQPEQHYDDGFQSPYASSSSSVQGLRNGHFSQLDLSAYANCQIDGVMQNQWPFGQNTDLSLLNLGNGDANRYPYQLPDYSSLLSSVNGYMYRPASGP